MCLFKGQNSPTNAVSLYAYLYLLDHSRLQIPERMYIYKNQTKSKQCTDLVPQAKQQTDLRLSMPNCLQFRPRIKWSSVSLQGLGKQRPLQNKNKIKKKNAQCCSECITFSQKIRNDHETVVQVLEKNVREKNNHMALKESSMRWHLTCILNRDPYFGGLKVSPT